MRGHFPNDVTRLRIHAVLPRAGAYPLVPLGSITHWVQAPSMTIPFVIGVNPLQTTLFELGIVSGRVALLLRSAEIQPLLERFVQMVRAHAFIIPPLPLV